MAAPTPYPKTLSDLRFPPSTPSPSIYHTLKHLRQHTLSLPNRLASILSDAAFASSIAAKYQLPLVANERCGSWYVRGGGGSAYFKSTDGHYGQWGFSLRRLNLELARVLGREGGAVLVDSTRRGKRVPDSLGKTVPVWVEVVNRVCFGVGARVGLQCWPGVEGEEDGGLGESEVSQIEARIGGFVERFLELGVDVEELRRVLKRPIRIRYEVNGVTEQAGEPGWDMLEDVDFDAEVPADGKERDSNLLVLCSVSRMVRGAEISEGGYIQGAGDDSEGWSHGLTPELFWANEELLMSTAEEELPGIIRGLVDAKRPTEGEMKPVLVKPTTGIYIAARATSNQPAEKDPNQEADKVVDASSDFDLIINCNAKEPSTQPKTFDLDCRTGKLGSRDLRDRLQAVKSFVATTFERNPRLRILITCATGKDLSVGVAVVLLCLFYNDQGNIGNSFGPRRMDKTLVKQRLAWISSSIPGVNPSRSTLQSVNAFLMERP